MIIYHDPRCVEYSTPGHPERPQRILSTVPTIRKRHPEWHWPFPAAADTATLKLAHTPEHIQAIEKNVQEFDADTPAYPNIYQHALSSAGAAIAAARSGLEGKVAFSLMRPPGHHATPDRAMGFCYFSNIAIAALDALKRGAERVAIWDFDVHHGNGTEDVIANHERITFASVHQSPAYPGTGLTSFANIHNFPLRPYIKRSEYVAVVQRAFDDLLAAKPDLILVSAGFDGYRGDPLSQMTLEPEDFATFGSWLRESKVRTAGVLEGGYSDELPELIDAFLTAWAGD
jgi:acetoin utilization deacetylase AcuC-like enzyme